MLKVTQNQVGFVVRVRLIDQDGVVIPLTDATELEILASPPRGATKSWTATAVDGDAAGILGYTTIAGDLAEFGVWRLQPHLVTALLDVRGQAQEFEVEVALDA